MTVYVVSPEVPMLELAGESKATSESLLKVSRVEVESSKVFRTTTHRLDGRCNLIAKKS